MRKLSKKQIAIIIIVAITIIALALIGVLYGIHNVEDKENLKKDDKIESVEDDKTDEEQEKKDTEKDITSVVEDESEENTSQSKVQTPEVEEPKQETTQQQQQSSTNTNNSQNQNNNNSGGGTTPSNPTPTPAPEPEKSPYAGMYHPKDAFALERLDKCANILKGGLVGDARYEYNMVDYFDGHIWISADSLSGAWMYIKIGYWDTEVDFANEEMKPVFSEIPVLMKQCFEALAPEGGTELYNTINSLIHQYGGPRKVPTQGAISESIPGLYVDVQQGKNGLELRFFAE